MVNGLTTKILCLVGFLPCMADHSSVGEGHLIALTPSESLNCTTQHIGCMFICTTCLQVEAWRSDTHATTIPKQSPGQDNRERHAHVLKYIEECMHLACDEVT